MTKKIVLESPFKNESQSIFNDNYFYVNVCARKMMKESDIAPLFFHTLYTQFLNDDMADERDLGLYRSFEYHSDAEEKIYAIDRGISGGMILGAEDAIKKGMTVKFFTVHPESTPIGKQISEINNIQDNASRWKAGVDFINHLKNEPSYAKRFEINGDLTNYKPYINPELKSVKECLLKFFEPIIKELKRDLAKESSLQK